tara:strand:+ start:359 stop:523 length:165 start_codon:yes stop_codon:yes gene_type:complete
MVPWVMLVHRARVLWAMQVALSGFKAFKSNARCGWLERLLLPCVRAASSRADAC